ncbi:uncharacterized protein A1O5_05405 [Cladophialophora psammophila CBS 110553]|uniref:Acyltransferase 3 domain-containing protein n=1 Tax=Cladophialophora psammophila CBS 110553 TaxID=1182543 RepID=W9WTR1_9EURO|nr:uncharacterized protein A1O5_05405 [Cladophialophora psammophila CBS 110553]EXJ71597.1 hypothetical protein A1O5_05405 [Cladophialophora psammophila CBS 110553]
MVQYMPLATDSGMSDHMDDFELPNIDLEKIPEQHLPKWYRLPGWQMSLRWEVPSKWSFWTTADLPNVKTAASLILAGVVVALPRFLRPGGLKRKKKLHPTAYLDALRGWAALLVLRFHMFWNRTWLLEQPVIRGFLNGRAMVEVFFVISGYVLSYRLLKMMRNQQHDLLRALASSTFRRWFRLFIPTGFGSLIVATASYLGWCRGDLHQDSFPAQMWDWFWDFACTTNPFADIKGWWYPSVFRTKYLDPMWTIPVEFRGSIVLFSFCAVAAFLSTRGRRICCSILILLCYFWWTIYAALFLIGLMIADLSFDRHPERLRPMPLPQQQDNEASSSRRASQQILNKVGCSLLVVVALFCFGIPQDGWSYQGPFPWDYLSKVIPWWYPIETTEYFWLSIGAAILVFALDNCRMLQIPFELGFSQYLGDLSFGIYVMHDIVNWCFYEPIVEPWRAAHLGDGYWSGLPGILITTTVVLWTADYFSRIDIWVVRFGRWLESKAFVKWQN